MTGPPFITIRRYQTVYGPRTISGYRWACERCGTYGIHRFNRWTDHVRRNNPDPHPWRRCLDAVDTHLRRWHRSPTSVTININIGGTS